MNLQEELQRVQNENRDFERVVRAESLLRVQQATAFLKSLENIPRVDVVRLRIEKPTT